MEGPGGGGGITFSGDEGSGPLGNLTQQSGWFAAAFAQEPNPMLAAPAGRPRAEVHGDLHGAWAEQRHVPITPGRLPLRELRGR